MGSGSTRKIGAIAVVAGLAAAAQVALAVPSHANTGAGVSGGILTVTAQAGIANRITIGALPNGDVVVTDTADPVTAGAGCAQTAANTVTCAGVTGIVVDVGDLDDKAANGSTLPSRLLGGPGADSLRGGGGNDRITGGPGDDDLFGEGGNDMFPADAVVDGADDVLGGPGIADEATYQARGVGVRASADGDPGDGEPGEGDNLGNDVENVTGTFFNDELIGNISGNLLLGQAGDDRLIGHAADDTLVGGPGADALFGADGADRLLARDNVMGNDTLTGGAGIDFCDADPLDPLFTC
ncbi:Hemolysin-type calcium-binding repeat-containing protein [Nonomuraea solani]|uniref:Hemolysin-type calcium-binding repeat-containing protein n=1 Tax=Nonomuraea solani TaxID=1144553 RepID=A0A1H6ERY0_9ACTN|nr:calcium-binding protein [Nonomuraea solani]SEG99851.1 Hemolysin-type calcium-binding repeat-containing protein [Nonomuraea solani]